MNIHLYDLFHQAGRTLLVALLPTLLIPLGAFLLSLVQGMMAIREESMLYAVRAITLALVIVFFGATVVTSFTELMRFALR